MKIPEVLASLPTTLILVILCQCCMGGCYAQKDAKVKSILDAIIDHAEEASLYRDSVDWPLLRAEMYALSAEADSVRQLKPALEYMLEELNDTHGRIFYKNQFLAYYSGEQPPHRENIDWDLYTEIQSTQIYPFRVASLTNEIGYVRIVGLPMGDNQKMSNDIQDAVCKIIEKGASKWIVDLRYNGGGNMFPMVEGLTTLIGDGIVGGTKGVTSQESSVWKIEGGDFYYDEQNVAIENKCPLERLPRIAVLTSVFTASSGEALAVILKGRPKTRFFGNKTMGMVTATDYAQIDEETAMSISVSYYRDRDGVIYREFVGVDEVIDFSPGVDNTIEMDEGILRAMKWLIE